jgi:hypothetical protein
MWQRTFPGPAPIALDVCDFIADEMKKKVSKEELTLLALHIQRVL